MADSTKKIKNVPSFTKKFWSLKKHPARMAAVIVVGLVVVGGGTAAAANSSKPGDLLYSVDTATEKIQLALSLSDQMDQKLHQHNAQERLSELQQLFKEKEVDAKGISVALANFEEHKKAATELSKNNDDATEVETELEGFQSSIDKLFEAEQKGLETARENLKTQADQAEAAGNTELAARLRAQADVLDAHLKEIEAKRETRKQEQQKFSEIDSEDPEAEVKPSEAEKEQQKSLQEAVKKEVEAQKEAEKKVQEQQKELEQSQKDDNSGSNNDSQSGDQSGDNSGSGSGHDGQDN